ncbi:hypothetical protein LguiB_035162 [Lonicera macranthoides]
MAAGDGSSQSLEYTPTWAVATVCFFMISVSILIEHSIHLLTNWLKKRRKTALYDAVDRLKSELMLLGFMSLLLAVTQVQISKICINTKVADVMLPCRKSETTTVEDYEQYFGVGAKRKLLYQNSSLWDPPRFLAEEEEGASNTSGSCADKGKVSLISQEGIQQLQIFIFVLAAMQIIYSLLTMGLGRAKAHSSARNNNFNFQKYIQKSLEEDFKVVVSISPLMWFIVVVFMLVDVHGWHVYLWISYVPLLIVLVLGTKLEVIVARMALQLKNQNSVIIGAILVQPNDDLFWFGRPRFVLTLLHLTLFVNAFELAFFVWVTIQFGWGSCYHEHVGITVTRIVLAVTVQVLCSYITLPLYALVTQMGSEFKSKALEEQIANIIKQWHGEVRAKRKKQDLNSSIQSARTSLSTDWSIRDSPSDFSSHHRPPPPTPTPLPLPSDSTNRGEITEEKY